MSKHIYVIFRPEHTDMHLDEIVRLVNTTMPDTFTYTRGEPSADLGSNSPWPGYMLRTPDWDDRTDYPYLWINFCCYWDTVLSDLRFREFVRQICESLGATQWWYIEENSIDLYDEMPLDEFQHQLTLSPGIETFSLPRYFPSGPHHIYLDTSQRVTTTMH